MGWVPWQNGDRTWTYPPLGEEMAEAGLQDIETYVARIQNNFVKYIETKIIMDLCLAVGGVQGCGF